MILVTIKRPNGITEEVEMNQTGLSDGMFSQVKTATANAGRGEVLSWRRKPTDGISDEKMAEYEKDVAEQKAFRDGQNAVKNAMTLNGTSK